MQKMRSTKLRTFGSCGKIVSRQKKSKASCIKEYFKVFFRENRMSITPRTEEEMHLQNMLTAFIKIEEDSIPLFQYSVMNITDISIS